MALATEHTTKPNFDWDESYRTLTCLVDVDQTLTLDEAMNQLWLDCGEGEFANIPSLDVAVAEVVLFQVEHKNLPSEAKIMGEYARLGLRPTHPKALVALIAEGRRDGILNDELNEALRRGWNGWGREPGHNREFRLRTWWSYESSYGEEKEFPTLTDDGSFSGFGGPLWFAGSPA